VRERLALDPESGALFVFASKRRNRITVLWFDHNGYCMEVPKKRTRRAIFQALRARLSVTSSGARTRE
jgi:hypothetical protein